MPTHQASPPPLPRTPPRLLPPTPVDTPCTGSGPRQAAAPRNGHGNFPEASVVVVLLDATLPRNSSSQLQLLGNALVLHQVDTAPVNGTTGVVYLSTGIDYKGREDPCRKTDVGRRFSCALPLIFGVTEPVWLPKTSYCMFGHDHILKCPNMQ
jgi:hypothetical protein